MEEKGKRIPVNTKYLYSICTMLDQRQRRWVDVVQMLSNVLCLLGFPIIEKCPFNSLHWSFPLHFITVAGEKGLTGFPPE